MNPESIELMAAEIARRAAVPGGALASARSSLAAVLGGGLVVAALAATGWFAHRRRPKTA
jgi:hypothetical protein